MEKGCTVYMMPIKFSGYTLFPEKSDHTEFELFLKFLIISEPSIANVFDFRTSLANKHSAVLLSHFEVLNQIPKLKDENEIIKQIGFSYNVQNVLFSN